MGVETTLVLGGTAKIGRWVVERSGARGSPVGIVSRSGWPPFDPEDQSTWEAALRGAGSMYGAYQPDLAVPVAKGLRGREAAAGTWSGSL